MVHGDISQRLRVQVVAARADFPLLRVRRKHMTQRPNYGVHRLLRRRRPQILRPHPANRRRRRMVPPRKMRSLFACRRFVVPQISADRQKPDLHPVRRQRIHILAHPGIADPEKSPVPARRRHLPLARNAFRPAFAHSFHIVTVRIRVKIVPHKLRPFRRFAVQRDAVTRFVPQKIQITANIAAVNLHPNPSFPAPSRSAGRS